MNENKNSNLKVITTTKKNKKKVSKKEPVQKKINKKFLKAHYSNKNKGDVRMSSDEKKREKQIYYLKMRKRRRRFFGFVFLILLILVGIILSLTVFFNIQNIKVEEKTIYTTKQIIDASEIKIRDNLILVNKNKTAKKIESKLPYVDSTIIKKKLPRTIVISVKPTTDKVAVEINDEMAILNENGKVLKFVKKDKVGTLILFKNVKVEKAEIGEKIEFENKIVEEAFLSIVSQIEKQKFEKINFVDLSNLNDIKLTYDNRITILLGDTKNIEQKLALGKHAIKRQNESNPQQKGKLDLSVEKKAFFRPEK